MNNFYKKIFLFGCVLCSLKAFSQNDTSKINAQDSVPIIRYDSTIVPARGTYPSNDDKSSTTGKKNTPQSIEPTGVTTQSAQGNYEAGATPGTLDVSPTGAATYTLPIALPPGINGVAPNVSLIYNSQGGNGMAGYGWNISGSSSISRIPSTKFHDDNIDAVDFDSFDRFALDGQRLILKSGTYGGNGAEYQTENYSNVRVFSRGVSPFGANYGPEYFEVYLPDGSKAFYGHNTNSRSRTEFAITYSENPLGLRINYDYAVYDNSMVIQNIHYGSTATTTPFNYIHFTYKAAARGEQMYVGGINFLRTQILDKITVAGNGAPYRSYQLNYQNITPSNYQKLVNIVETSGDQSKTLEPVNFTYKTSGPLVTPPPITTNVINMDARRTRILTADFTGDGTMDFIAYPDTKHEFFTFWDPLTTDPRYLGTRRQIGFQEIFPVSWLTSNNKILSGQGIGLVKKNSNTYNFEVYSIGTVTDIGLQYQKEWLNPPQTPGYYSYCINQYKDGQPIDQTFLSGDFNGDGLTDVMAVNKALYAISSEIPGGDTQRSTNTTSTNNIDQPQGCTLQYTYIESKATFIDLDRRLTNNYVTDAGAFVRQYQDGDKLEVADFNGDGKMDVLHVSTYSMYVYALNSSNQLELLWQTNDNRIIPTFSPLLGDYNGDGKMDAMITSRNVPPGNDVFTTFLSTGMGFTGAQATYTFRNQAGRTLTPQAYENYYLTPTDADGDGKTDMIFSYTISSQNPGEGHLETMPIYNLGINTSTGAPIFQQALSEFREMNNINMKQWPIPVFLSANKQNHKLEMGFSYDNYVRQFIFSKDIKIETQLAGVSHAGIEYRIDYKPLEKERIYNPLPAYEYASNQTFPNVGVWGASSLFVVNKLTRIHNSNTLQRVFAYRDGVSDAEGLGFLGFGKTIQTNWHTGESDVNKIYTVTFSDPQKRGAPVKIITSKSGYTNPNVENITPLEPDITRSDVVPNSQTVTASNSVTLLPGFTANGNNGAFVANIQNPATGINDNGTLNDYITRTDYTYKTELLANKVFVNAPTSVAVKDVLNGTNTLNVNSYDGYYNVTKSVTNSSGAGTKTEEIVYANNNSVPGYYIGRPLNQKTTVTNGGDTYTTEQQITYTGYLPTQIKKKGHKTSWITETMQYDGLGNVTQKTISTPSSGQRTVSMQYDATGRFVTQVTDADGMISKSQYNLSTGNVLAKTNPYNQTENYAYDSWNRLTSSTDYLNKVSYREYLSDGWGIIKTYEHDDEGREKYTWVNALGNTKEVLSKTVTGSFVGKSYSFDVYDRQTGESEPAAQNSYNQWNTTSFDSYGRVKQTISYTGKTTNINYAGLTVTVNDGTKSVTTTKNALGQTVSLTDPGGIINYSYYANGNMKAADYGGSTQSLEYDGWGRKTKLTDPSAGVYTYTYDDFGQVTNETNPKGNNQYTYDPAGKLTAKTVQGDNNTNLGYTYNYDGTTKLLMSLTLTNNDGNNTTYLNTYDNQKRLSTTVEDNQHARFYKSFTYDAFGRMSTETYVARNKANNRAAQRTVVYAYQYGETLQSSDQSSGQILSKVNTLTTEGRLATEQQGASLRTTYSYTNYGLPQNTITEKITGSTGVLMNLGYSFNAQRGILDSRSNTALNWNETFQHDNQDRLTAYTDNTGTHNQNYDGRGRITNNSDVGDYTYSGPSYQQAEINNINPNALNWYQTRPVQNITYTAFKKPITITEQGKEIIDFQYNGALQRAHMYYGGQQADKMNRPMRRHYSEDGSMEITNDLVNNTTSFIFYLDGDAYSAPAIWKEVHTATATTSATLYYLHRNHLGSIVMISDLNGGIVEKRQFDAWGNIVKLTDWNGNALATFAVLDRGYTGHEHLFNVALINMNGRLYDAKLHRFLSPDNFVQDPFNTQNFNRYGYVLNNPLLNTDQSGEMVFAALLPFIFKGILIGAASGAAGYLGNAVRTGNFSLGGLGMAALGGAVIGGFTGGLNPWGVVTTNLTATLGSAYIAGFLPSANFRVGDFGFNISPSIAFGQSFGFGANLGVSYTKGKLTISGGIGFMAYGNYQGFGKGGIEIRNSLLASYGGKNSSISLGTNTWISSGGMSEFELQRTGILKVRSGDFGFSYENDGMPFGMLGTQTVLGDGYDSHRTAAASLSWKEVSVGFNLFTGTRRDYSGDDEKIGSNPPGQFDEKMPNGYVKESETRYRLGALSVRYMNYRVGINSDRYVRHPIQNMWAHNMKFPLNTQQPGFMVLSKAILGYFQYQTLNNFTSW